jgi:hypothetical protein
MDIHEQAKKRKTTRHPENWRKKIMISLGTDDIKRAARLCKRHNMNRSELIRYLLLKDDE